jgi:predicted DNA-binding protein YlxM (UPF0122 family)
MSVFQQILKDNPIVLSLTIYLQYDLYEVYQRLLGQKQTCAEGHFFGENSSHSYPTINKTMNIIFEIP